MLLDSSESERVTQLLARIGRSSRKMVGIGLFSCGPGSESKYTGKLLLDYLFTNST
jgi:hypothetical protein